MYAQRSLADLAKPAQNCESGPQRHSPLRVSQQTLGRHSMRWEGTPTDHTSRDEKEKSGTIVLRRKSEHQQKSLQ